MNVNAIRWRILVGFLSVEIIVLSIVLLVLSASEAISGGFALMVVPMIFHAALLAWTVASLWIGVEVA